MNEGQLIVSIGREFGSGGHEIAEKLSKRLGLPLYDSNLLEEIAEKKNVNVKNLEKYDEVPKVRFFYRRVQGYSNSPEENIAKIQFDYLRSKAQAGESFIIVGRCAEEILKDYPGLVSIFILGDMDKKIERICRKYNVSAEEAETMIVQTNKKRKAYHNYYCKGKWGDSRNYELSINSGKLTIDKTTDLIEIYIGEKYSLTKPLNN